VLLHSAVSVLMVMVTRHVTLAWLVVVVTVVIELSCTAGNVATLN
jgi:hypothetical protein